jgi:hypothetical protein
MSQSKGPATIIAIGLIIGISLGGFLLGGIYESHTAIKGVAVYRVNKFTGVVSACFLGHTCEVIPETTAPTMNPSAFSPVNQSDSATPVPKHDFLYGAEPSPTLGFPIDPNRPMPTAASSDPAPGPAVSLYFGKALTGIIAGVLIPVGLRVKRQRAGRRAALLRQIGSPDAAISPPASSTNGLLFLFVALAVIATLLLLDARRP